MARPGDKIYQIDALIKVAPSHTKAFLAEFCDSDGEILGETWLPYSRVKAYDTSGGDKSLEVTSMMEGEITTLNIPLWLLETDRVAPLVREQMLAADYAGQEDDEGTDADSAFYDDDPGWGE